MTTSDITRRRLHNQHLSRPSLQSPDDVVRWFGAVQAQEFLSSLYAIGLRMPATTEQSVESAVTDRTIVRTWPMRGTIHFVPPEDIRWMVKLMAPRVNLKMTGMYRGAGLTDDIFERAGEVISRVLRGGKQLLRKELYTALAEEGISTSGGYRGNHIVGYWAREGLICIGPRRGKQQTVVLLDERVPESRMLEGEEALATLARRYFTSHGPATVQDFTWWSGLTSAEARLGIETAGDDLVQETIGTRTYWSGSSAPPEGEPGPDAYLLPPFDEYTVAYKDRSAFLDPTISREVAMYGIGPSVIVGGKMVGTWTQTFGKAAVAVSVSPFGSLNASQKAAITEAAERYGKFFQLDVDLDFANP